MKSSSGRNMEGSLMGFGWRAARVPDYRGTAWTMPRAQSARSGAVRQPRASGGVFVEAGPQHGQPHAQAPSDIRVAVVGHQPESELAVAAARHPKQDRGAHDLVRK